MLDHRVSVPFVLHGFHVWSGVALVRGPQLVVPDHLLVGHFLPLRSPDVMLRVDKSVAEEALRTHHLHELFDRHRVPLVTIDLGIVNLCLAEVSVSGPVE